VNWLLPGKRREQRVNYDSIDSDAMHGVKRHSTRDAEHFVDRAVLAVGFQKAGDGRGTGKYPDGEYKLRHNWKCRSGLMPDIPSRRG
jgi:hypothetical protein